MFKPVIHNVRQYSVASRGSALERTFKTGERHARSPEMEFFVFLCVFRQGFDQQDIAFRLDLHQSAISRIWNTWLHLAHRLLTQIPMWLNRATIRRLLRDSFKKHFPLTRVLFDCMEMFIKMPSMFRARSETFSPYKHHNTAKGLVVVAPHGAMPYVSLFYGGKWRDKAIVKVRNYHIDL